MNVVSAVDIRFLGRFQSMPETFFPVMFSNRSLKVWTMKKTTMNDAYALIKEIRMTDNEKASYLRGRRDKTCEVIQDIYCNHGGNSHPVYDFFQDSEIGYEEIVGWKQAKKIL